MPYNFDSKHSVSKSPKMFEFLIWAFFVKFCQIKINLSGNTLWQQKTRQIDYFRITE